jgi:hypothetical protein
MKKLLLMVTAVALLTTSCSRQTTLEQRLDGETWKVTKSDMAANGVIFSTLEDGETPTLTFYEDGNGIWANTFDDPGTGTLTWSVDEDGRTLTFAAENEPATVFSVSEDSTYEKLVLFSSEDIDGENHTISLVLEKQ